MGQHGEGLGWGRAFRTGRGVDPGGWRRLGEIRASLQLFGKLQPQTESHWVRLQPVTGAMPTQQLHIQTLKWASPHFFHWSFCLSSSPCVSSPTAYPSGPKKPTSVCVCVRERERERERERVTQSCSTLCDAKDWSLPGSSVRGILQARILEWVATLFSRGSS